MHGNSIPSFPRHHCQELRKVNGSVPVCVHLVDHVLQFSLSGVLPEGPHDGPQLFGGDSAVTVLVEQREGLLEFGNLFFCQFFGHCMVEMTGYKICGTVSVDP
eukprot:GFUD01023518.1.p1 GENE.GFUD01023518.1~~GFUD01023518.1.p1  ORF type:complete len:103 (+),score=7.18 GFUD01023518.1:99-407(+)